MAFGHACTSLHAFDQLTYPPRISRASKNLRACVSQVNKQPAVLECQAACPCQLLQMQSSVCGVQTACTAGHSQSGASTSETTKVATNRNPPLQQRPGARRPLGMPLKSENVDPAESALSPVLPATADPASSSRPQGLEGALVDSTRTPVAGTKSSLEASPRAPEESKAGPRATVSSGTGTIAEASATSESSTKQSLPRSGADASTAGAAWSGLEASAASGTETWPRRVWPQPPPPLGAVFLSTHKNIRVYIQFFLRPVCTKRMRNQDICVHGYSPGIFMCRGGRRHS